MSTDLGKHIAHIIPAKAKDGELPLANGTRVMVGDRELSGVTEVVIRGSANDVWRAEIHCLCSVEDFLALVDHLKVAPKYVTKQGQDVAEVTGLDSAAREYTADRLGG